MSTSIQTRGLHHVYKYILILITVYVVAISYQYFSFRFIPHNVIDRNSSLDQNKTNSTRVLVIYVYAKTHLLSEANLDYFVILQQVNNAPVNESNLPILPSYANYIQHENKCFDLGTVGWFLSSGV